MTQHNSTPEENFDDIRPYTDGEFRTKLLKLAEDPGFEHAVRYIMPEVNYNDFIRNLIATQTQADFQRHIMGNFLEMLVTRTTEGLSCSGLENLSPGKAYTFITNHRDIVLDASFLNLCFIRNNLPITQVAIGNNLLIYDWITDLVKLNRSFIVKRDTGIREALESARHLSAYIHRTVAVDHQSVWIAQREGRAKDSNDRTQESVIKMLSLGGDDDCCRSLRRINLTPVSISYEYDPNDYLKVREFLMRRRDPDFKKSQRDDLFSMETGLLKQKGRVHFHIGACINDALISCEGQPRAEVVRKVCDTLDRAIHCGYRIFPCNYIAFDICNNTEEYRSRYTDTDVMAFQKYIDSQLAKVDVPDITPQEYEFMHRTMLDMYANPLRNQRLANGCDTI